jgi:hypothetical protein
MEPTQAVEPTQAMEPTQAVEPTQAMMNPTQWKAVARIREVCRTIAASTCSPTLIHSVLNDQGIEMH